MISGTIIGMKISAQEFRDQLAARAPRQRLIFVGMSGVGKSHWSTRLASRYGYELIELDELIGNSPELKHLIQDHAGKDNAEKLGRYFGMPWEPGFAEREQKLLAVEQQLLQSDFPSDAMLDLGGSVIYSPQEMTRLATTGLVIYLSAGQAEEERMLRTFLARPKPVCWNGHYHEHFGESHATALARCYPELLHARAREYTRYADITIDFPEQKPLQTAEEFAELIVKKLESKI